LLFVAAVFVAAVLFSAFVDDGNAHLVAQPASKKVEHVIKSQEENLAHAKYVCNNGANANKRWHCKAKAWLRTELSQSEAKLIPTEPDWIAIQIHYAELIGQGGDAGGTDPWPNCPDPYDHAGHSWYDTVACENPVYGWYDGPGYYRCGLQFDPGWERRYGVRFCP